MRDDRLRVREGATGALTPLIVFAVLAVLLVAGGAVAVLLTPDHPNGAGATRPAGTPTEEEQDFSLTDAEAIARLEELDAKLGEAFEERSVRLAGSLYLDHSPVLDKALRDIRTLRRKGVLVDIDTVTKSVEVTRNTPIQIELRQTAIVAPSFFNAAGDEVTASDRPERHVIEWTLRPREREWLIYDALVVSAKPIQGR